MLEKLLLVNAILGGLFLVFGVLVELDRRARAKKAELRREIRRRKMRDEQERKNREWAEYMARIEAMEEPVVEEEVIVNTGSTHTSLSDRLDNYNCFSSHDNRNNGRSFTDIMSGYTVGEVLDTFYY